MESYLIVALLALAGGALRGLIGFGPGVLLIVGSGLVLGSRDAILIASTLDVLGGCVAMLLLRRRHSISFLNLPAVVFVLGSVVGGLTLRELSSQFMVWAVTVGVVIAAAVSILGSTNPRTRAPSRAVESVGALVGGVVGGIVGMPGPVVSAAYSTTTPHRDLSRRLVPLLFAGALARVAVYAGSGQLGLFHLRHTVAAAPFAVLGVAIGFRISPATPDRVLRLLVAVLLFASVILTHHR